MNLCVVGHEVANLGRSLSPASEFEDETTGDVHEDERGDHLVFLDRMTVLDRPSIGARLGQQGIRVGHVEFPSAWLRGRLVCLLVMKVDQVIYRVDHVEL